MHNQQHLIGHVGTNPESTVLDNGTTVTRFTLATNKSWKNDQGGRQDRTTWFNIRAYGKLAEIMADYVRKGKLMHIIGETVNQSYEKDGQRKFFSYVKVETFNFLSKKSGQEKEPASNDQPPVTTGKGEGDDDLPF